MTKPKKKRTPVTPVPEGYRLLAKGEVVREGDIGSMNGGEWNEIKSYLGSVIIRPGACARKKMKKGPTQNDN